MSDPWGSPDAGRTDPHLVVPPGAFIRGVARVGVPRPRAEDPTTTAVDQPPPSRPWPVRAPARARLRQLRVGGEWTSMGILFAFVCWGIWAVSSRDGDLGVPVLSFLLVLAVAAGLFGLLRVLGRVVLVRTLGRTRRGARGAHLATGLFLAAAGIAFLGQTPWVVDAWTWVMGQLW